MEEQKVEEKEYEFIIFCIESYKEKQNLNGKEVYNLFKDRGVLEFLKDGYDVLHTQGKDYILETIDEFLIHHP